MQKGIFAAGAAVMVACLSGNAKAAFISSETVMVWAPKTSNVGQGDPGYDAMRNVVHVSSSTYAAMSVPGIVANGIADYLDLPKIVSPWGSERRQTVPVFENAPRFTFESGGPIHAGGGGGSGGVPQGPSVPAPGVLALLGLGILVMGGRRAR
ncbi:MAG: PEP-CTERM sorting domain-containing protein [Alphaproteobacteria bacterium]|nr:MAG: PEP-CTERM sorting domain-containing protein [Alphaproteobacteria bacterium]